jgi:transitional endoplasmic reticulum ATPase
MQKFSPYPYYSWKMSQREISRRRKYENVKYKYPSEAVKTIDHKLLPFEMPIDTNIRPVIQEFRYTPDSPYCSQRQFLFYRRYLDQLFNYGYCYQESILTKKIPIEEMDFCEITKTYYLPVLVEDSPDRIPFRLYFVTFLKKYHAIEKTDKAWVFISSGKNVQPAVLTHYLGTSDSGKYLKVACEPFRWDEASPILETFEEFEEITKKKVEAFFIEKKIKENPSLQDHFHNRLRNTKTLLFYYSRTKNNVLTALQVHVAVVLTPSGSKQRSLLKSIPAPSKLGVSFNKSEVEEEERVRPSKNQRLVDKDIIATYMAPRIKKILSSGFILRYQSKVSFFNKSKILCRDWEAVLTITSLNPVSDVLRIDKNTVVNISYIDCPKKKWLTTFVGYQKEIKYLEDSLLIPLKYPELFKYYNLKPPSGVLLYGPPGTGKTLLARQLSIALGINYIYKSAPEFLDKWVGEGEKEVRELFRSAKEEVPCLIVIDEIDIILGKREGSTEHDKKLVTQFLTELDGLDSRQGVLVIGLTNRINSIDPAIRREGRFGLEVQIGLPNIGDRYLQLVERTKEIPLSAVNLNNIAERTSGYSGADLELLIREATMRSLKRIFDANANLLEEAKKKEGGLSYSVFSLLEVTKEDFEESLTSIRPTLLKEDKIEKPEVYFKDIIGLEQEKKEIISAVKMLRGSYLEKISSFKPIRGILLEGPPGTGKTLLAKAIATQYKYAFLNIDSSTITSKWVGDSEKIVSDLFKRARASAPCIIFIDEIDSVLPTRKQGSDESMTLSRTVNQFLMEMDGLRGATKVLLVGATNRRELLDPAFLRPGRMDKIIKIGLPKLKDIIEMIKYFLREVEIPKEVEPFITKTLPSLFFKKGFSGAEVDYFCKELLLRSFNETSLDIKITRSTIDQALKNLLSRSQGTEVNIVSEFK